MYKRITGEGGGSFNVNVLQMAGKRNEYYYNYGGKPMGRLIRRNSNMEGKTAAVKEEDNTSGCIF